MEVGLKITFPVISPEPEVAAMIHFNLICGHISVFQRFQDCPNRFSYLRETDVSSWRVELKITFPIISPEPEVTAIIHLQVICGHILAFKRAQDWTNRFSYLREKDVRRGAHTYTHIHTDISDLVELSRMVYHTSGLRGSGQKLFFPAILYPFYRER